MATTRPRRRGGQKSGSLVRVIQGILAVPSALAGVFLVIVSVTLVVDSNVLPGLIVAGFGLGFLLWATRLTFRAATGKRAPARATGPSAVFFGGGDSGDFGGDGGGGDGC